MTRYFFLLLIKIIYIKGSESLASPKTAISKSPTSDGIKTIETAQKSPTLSNLSQMSASMTSNNSKNNNDIGTVDDDGNVTLPRTPISANVRFMVALSVLVSQGFALVLCEKLLTTPYAIFQASGTFFILFISFFASEVGFLL